jgi:hypothetical protein
MLAGAYVCGCVCVCVCVRATARGARTKTAPGAGMSLSEPSMPAAFWMTHGPHAHRVGSCSPGWSGASATLAHVVDPCIRILGSTVQRADGKCTGGPLAAAHGKDIDARTHALPESDRIGPWWLQRAGTSLKLMRENEIVTAACSDASILQ